MKKNISEEEEWLDQLLKEDPDYLLSDDFSDKLMTKIDAVETVKESIYEFMMIIGVILAILGTFFAVYYFFQKDNLELLTSIFTNGYTPAIVFIAIFILFADKVLLRVLSQLKRL